MKLFLMLSTKETSGFVGAWRGFRADSREGAEEMMREHISMSQFGNDQTAYELWEVAPGCLLGPELKEDESGVGAATGSGQPETCCGETPAVDR